MYGILIGTRGAEQEIKDLLTDAEFDKITFIYGDIVHFRTIDKLFKTFFFLSLEPSPQLRLLYIPFETPHLFEKKQCLI